MFEGHYNMGSCIKDLVTAFGRLTTIALERNWTPRIFQGLCRHKVSMKLHYMLFPFKKNNFDCQGRLQRGSISGTDLDSQKHMQQKEKSERTKQNPQSHNSSSHGFKCHCLLLVSLEYHQSREVTVSYETLTNVWVWHFGQMQV